MSDRIPISSLYNNKEGLAEIEILDRRANNNDSNNNNNNNNNNNGKEEERSKEEEVIKSIQTHYHVREDQGIEGRERSSIKYMRNFNNWIKSVLIDQQLKDKGERAKVFDFCCGKLGDMRKWINGKCGYVACADYSYQSLQDAIERYNHIKPYQKFPVGFYYADCFKVDFDKVFERGLSFDLVSCQFSLHYSFQTEERARRMVSNVACRLRKGGVFIGTIPNSNVIVKRIKEGKKRSFGNSVYKITYTGSPEIEEVDQLKFPKYGAEYTFTLTDAVEECPEFLVHFPTFTSLCNEYGMELIAKDDFHHYFLRHQHEYDNLLNVMKVRDINGSISVDEWEAIYLYQIFVFRKVSEKEGEETPFRPPPISEELTKNDIICLAPLNNK